MKTDKLYYALLSILLFMASCVDDKMGGSQNETYSFTAQIEQDNSTRTTVNAQNQVLWTTGDEIGIYGNQQTKNALFTLQTANGTSAQFSGELKSGEQPDFAYYPYQKGAELNGSSLTFELPDEYVYTGNSNAPMIGFDNGNQSLAFKHLCGLMKVTVRDVPEKSVQFVITSEGKNPQPIAGTAVVDDVYAEDAILSIKEQGDKAYTITYQLSGSVTNREFTFFIPLPVGEYDKLTVSLRSAEDDVLYQKSTSNVRIKRAYILSMPTLSGDEDISYVLAENTVQLSRDDENYIQSATAVDATSDHYTITYYGDTPEDKIPQVGQVLLYSEITDKFPAGFLGRVTAVEQTDDTYIVHAEPATLDATFDELYIDKELNFLGNIADDVLAQNGIERAAQTKAVRDSTIELKIPLGYRSVQFPPKDPYAEIKLSGGIALKSKAHLDIRLNKKERLEYMQLSLDNTTTTNITSELSIFVETDNDKELGKRDVEDIISEEIPCGKYLIGPLVISPNVIWGISVSASGKGSITNEFNNTKKSKFFLEIDNGKLNMESPDQEDTSDENVTSNKLSIDLEGKFAIGPKIGIQLIIFPAEVELSGSLMGELGLEYHLDPSNIGNGVFYSKIKDSKATASAFIQGNASVGAGLFDWIKVEAGVEPQWMLGSTERYIVPSMENLRVEEETVDGSTYISYNVIHDTFWPFNFGLKLYDEDGNELHSDLYTSYSYPKDWTVIGLGFQFDGLEKEKTYIAKPFFRFLGSEIVTDISKEFYLPDNEKMKEVLRKFYETSGGDNWTANQGWFEESNIRHWYGIREHWKGNNIFVLDLENNNLTGNPILENCDFIGDIEIHDNPIKSLTLESCYDIDKIILPGNGENLKIAYSGNYSDYGGIQIAGQGGKIGNMTISDSYYENVYFSSGFTNMNNVVHIDQLNLNDMLPTTSSTDLNLRGDDDTVGELNIDNCWGEYHICFQKITQVNVRNHNFSDEYDYLYFGNSIEYVDKSLINTINIDQGGKSFPRVDIVQDIYTLNIMNVVNDENQELRINFNSSTNADVQEIKLFNVDIDYLLINIDKQKTVKINNSTLKLPGVTYYYNNKWSDTNYDEDNLTYILENCTLKFDYVNVQSVNVESVTINSFRGTIPQLREYLESLPEFNNPWGL